jgi:serine/threonine protein kinase
MGQIYRTYHPSLERDVAIKLIHIYKANDPEIVYRFRREAKMVAALRHPGIIQIYDFDADLKYDIFYMVMEFVRGESLAHRLNSIEAQGGQMSLEEALRIFRLITEAVAYAHDRGVIHRDLKPENVMLTTQGQPILTDLALPNLSEVNVSPAPTPSWKRPTICRLSKALAGIRLTLAPTYTPWACCCTNSPRAGCLSTATPT